MSSKKLYVDKGLNQADLNQHVKESKFSLIILIFFVFFADLFVEKNS